MNGFLFYLVCMCVLWGGGEVDGEMSQQIKELAAKPEYLSSIPRFSI